MNSFKKKDSKKLVDVAMGRVPASLVIKNGRWVCVQTGEIIGNTDVAISDQRIAFVGDNADHCIGDNTKVVDAQNKYLVPGLIDAHMHIRIWHVNRDRICAGSASERYDDDDGRSP